MVTVKHHLKGENDGPPLGLIICKFKDNVKVQYALEASRQPMGISAYNINTFLSEDYKSSLPTIEEIEEEKVHLKYFFFGILMVVLHLKRWCQ